MWDLDHSGVITTNGQKSKKTYVKKNGSPRG